MKVFHVVARLSISSRVCRGRIQSRMMDNMIYMWFCPCSSQFYIGKTNKGFCARTMQHYRNLMDPVTYAKSQIRFYRVVRRGLPFQFGAIPLVGVTHCCDTELRFLEQQWINRLHPPLNTPFVYKFDKVEKGDKKVITSVNRRIHQPYQRDRRKRRVCEIFFDFRLIQGGDFGATIEFQKCSDGSVKTSKLGKSVDFLQFQCCLPGPC